MFIKDYKCRLFLTKCAESKNLPKINKNMLKKEPNMKLVDDMIEELKSLGYNYLPEEFQAICTDLSRDTSSVSMFQVINRNILVQFIEDIKIKNSFSAAFTRQYPNVQHRLRDIVALEKSHGRDGIPQTVRKIFCDLAEFTLEFYDSLEERDEDEDYTPAGAEEEFEGEFFPHFPPLYKRPKYEADEKLSRKDADSEKNLCTKLFPEHNKLSPGLFIVTCCCPQKKVYGFKMLGFHESPRILVDIATTRFEPWYNPTIIYDASCKVKEVGLNREPRRFMEMLITSDPLHIDNHSTCSDSFESTKYENLKPLNKEACEQFNNLLRSVQTSLTYMTYKHFMVAMKVFIAVHNNSKFKY